MCAWLATVKLTDLRWETVEEFLHKRGYAPEATREESEEDEEGE
jgi:hypothetical protein